VELSDRVCRNMRLDLLNRVSDSRNAPATARQGEFAEMSGEWRVAMQRPRKQVPSVPTVVFRES
jgi:hypothetical protein